MLFLLWYLLSFLERESWCAYRFHDDCKACLVVEMHRQEGNSMIPLLSRPKTAGASSRLSMKRRKRFSGKMLIGASVLLALALLATSAGFALQTLIASHAASYSRDDRHNRVLTTTINGLRKITQVGSTA